MAAIDPRPQETEAERRARERYYSASQWTLIWWRFRRHRMAMAGAAVLGLTELGDLLLKSFLDLDMNVAGAILLMLTVVIVVMNFLSDLLLAWLDPRIQLGG